MNEWSYTSSPSVCLHGVHRFIFTITLPFIFQSISKSWSLKDLSGPCNWVALNFNQCSAIEKICNKSCKSCFSACVIWSTSHWHSVSIQEWKQIKYKLPRTPELFQKMLIIFIRRSMRDYPRHSMQGFTGGWRKQHNARFSWFILFLGGV